MRRERHVIIGAGAAGARAAEAMRGAGFAGEIVMVGAEPELPYHRPPLSKEFLGPEPMDRQELLVHPESFYRENQVELEKPAAGPRGAPQMASSKASAGVRITAGPRFSSVTNSARRASSPASCTSAAARVAVTRRNRPTRLSAAARSAR